MYLRLVLEVTAALFAVFGIYSAVRLAVQKLLGSDKIFLCVEIKNQEDAENADILVREALSAFLVTSSCRVAIIVSPELAANAEVERVIEIYGVECYIAQKNKG